MSLEELYGVRSWDGSMLIYDESDALCCPSCKAVMTWSSGKKKFCADCGFADACCN